MEKSKFIIYKTTNIKTNEYYIGCHSTNDINDRYLGSGVIIKQKIKEYGRNYFKKNILFVYDNEDEMFDMEKQLITDQVLSDPMSYNISYGGVGGKKHTDETRERISLNNSRYWKYNKRSKEQIEKHRQAVIGRKRADYEKENISKTMIGVAKPKACCIICRKEESWIAIARNHKNCDGPKDIVYKHNRVTCPHCGVTGGRNNMTRYHFDNCNKRGPNNE